MYNGAVMIYGYGYDFLTYDFMVPCVIPCDIIIYLAVPCATLLYLVQPRGTLR